MAAVGYCSVLLGLILGADPSSQDGFEESEFQACGPCCIYMACVLKGIEADLESPEGSSELGPRGESSLGDLGDLARVSGLQPVAAKLDFGTGGCGQDLDAPATDFPRRRDARGSRRSIVLSPRVFGVRARSCFSAFQAEIPGMHFASDYRPAIGPRNQGGFVSAARFS